MGKVIIQKHTTKHPIQMIGEEAGICYGSDISSEEKNYKRGLQCIKDGHGRTTEFPQVYLIIEGYSARFMRELYTHIGGAPTRLQASTRYIKYGEFDFITPYSIANNPEALEVYNHVMDTISDGYRQLEDLGVPKEDTANILPLGMESKMVLRTNLRNLVDMSHQRECARAYWEFREFMRDLKAALSEYSDEWKLLVDSQFMPKCELTGYCTEKFSCGRRPQKALD